MKHSSIRNMLQNNMKRNPRNDKKPRLPPLDWRLGDSSSHDFDLFLENVADKLKAEIGRCY